MPYCLALYADTDSSPSTATTAQAAPEASHGLIAPNRVLGSSEAGVTGAAASCPSSTPRTGRFSLPSTPLWLFRLARSLSMSSSTVGRFRRDWGGLVREGRGIS